MDLNILTHFKNIKENQETFPKHTFEKMDLSNMNMLKMLEKVGLKLCGGDSNAKSIVGGSKTIGVNNRFEKQNGTQHGGISIKGLSS